MSKLTGLITLRSLFFHEVSEKFILYLLFYPGWRLGSFVEIFQGLWRLLDHVPHPHGHHPLLFGQARHLHLATGKDELKCRLCFSFCILLMAVILFRLAGCHLDLATGKDELKCCLCFGFCIILIVIILFCLARHANSICLHVLKYRHCLIILTTFF